MIHVKSEKEIELMREPCKIVRDTLNFVGSKISAGMSTKEVDELVERYIRASGAYPSCLGYGGFPASACISVNEVVVHGIPGERILREGDIVSVDLCAYKNGYHGDACRTFRIGKVVDEVDKLVQVTEECFFKGIEGLRAGERTMANTYEIRKQMLADMVLYGITEVVAHNARFDQNALNVIQRWTTKSKYRYWFPYDTEVWDTMKMARDVIHKMPTYKKFCETHGFLTSNGRLSTTAENLYRFIIKDPTFEESHTGLEDVQIEREIMWYCMRQHKKMRKGLYEK